MLSSYFDYRELSRENKCDMGKIFSKLFRTIILLILVVCIFQGQILADDTLPKEETQVDFSLADVETVTDVNALSKLNAKNVILVEADSMRVLYEKDAHVKRSNASTTKILTAIVAIEMGNTEEVVTVSQKAANIGGSTINLRRNEKIKLLDLLYGLMLKSGNDAAVAIAEHIGGSVDEFMELVNKKAKEIGAQNTHFTSPHGLDNPDHYSTAYDLALITSYCMKNDLFRDIVSTAETYISDRSLRNTNDLLFTYEGTTGVKTGFTNGANRCLIASAKRDGMEVICVVLGCDNKTARFKDSKVLLDHAFNNYKKVNLINEGDILKNISINKGMASNVNAISLENIIMPLTEDEKSKLEYKYVYSEKLDAPVEKGTVVGELYITCGDKALAKTSLLLEESVEKKGIFNFLKDIFQQWCLVL